jgi:DNA-binding PadR family transcriptional regulator
MARSSQTELAVLGALSVQPMTGYALREEIRQVLGHFWSESYGQIYPTLAELQRNGLIEAAHGRRSGSSTYTLTPQGRDRLTDLLRQPHQPTPPRNALMLRLFFGRTLGVDACSDLIRQARSEAVRRLAEFKEIRAELAADPNTEHHPYWLLTISAGEHTARAAIAWADESLDALRQLNDAQAN